MARRTPAAARTTAATDDGDDSVTGTEGGGTGGASDPNSGSVVPASNTTSTGTSSDNGVGGLLAQTGPLGLVGLALLGLVLIVSGGMLAKHASDRPGLAENPWVHKE